MGDAFNIVMAIAERDVPQTEVAIDELREQTSENSVNRGLSLIATARKNMDTIIRAIKVVNKIGKKLFYEKD